MAQPKQPRAVSLELLATARSLAVDGVTAEVVRAFRAEGIDSVLIKGPTVAAWLYDDGTARSYLDSDLVVEPACFGRSERVLERLGFSRHPVPPLQGRIAHAVPWTRARDRAEVDLHRTLPGVAVTPAEAWRQLIRQREGMVVGGVEVAVPRRSLRALLVVLHAAQHGPEKAKPLADLRRAIARVDEREWREVAHVALELEATGSFARGLRLIPEGAALADRLGLVSIELVELATDNRSRARVALGIERLASTRGARAKLRLGVRELFPTAETLRWWSPLARRGRLGLAVAAAWRPLWVLIHTAPSLLAWRRARRAARGVTANRSRVR